MQATALGMGLGLAVACLLVAGLLRFAWAYWLGWAVQVVAILLGLVVATMFFLGAIFMALWATAYVPRSQDRGRAGRSGRSRGSTPAGRSRDPSGPERRLAEATRWSGPGARAGGLSL